MAPTSLPVIAAVVDAHLAAWAIDQEVSTYSAWDSLVLGHRLSDGPVLAYDPRAQLAYEVTLPAGAEAMYPYFADGTRVAGSLTAMPGRDVAPFAVIDVASGAIVPVEPLDGYDGLDIYERSDGYAFGSMVRRSGVPFDPEYHTRAIVVDLTTGAVTDVSPADAVRDLRAEARGVSAGQALVVLFDATSELSPPRRIEVVDIATGARAVVEMTDQQLAAISDAYNPGSLRLEDGALFGSFIDVFGGPSQPFRYDVETGALGPGPCGIRIDKVQYLCVDPGSSPPDTAQVVVFDAERATTSPIPTPGLTPPWPLLAIELAEGRIALSDGRVLLGDGVHAPLVYDLATGTVSRLDVSTVLDGRGLGVPTALAIVGDRIVAASAGDGWTDARFDPRVWSLP